MFNKQFSSFKLCRAILDLKGQQLKGNNIY